MWRRSPRDLRDQFCKLLESELDGTWCFAHLPRTVYLVLTSVLVHFGSYRSVNHLFDDVAQLSRLIIIASVAR